MTLTGTSVFTQYERQKKDISDVTTNLRIQWLDHLNRWFHNQLSGIDPERLIAVQNYTVTAKRQTEALPDDFQSLLPKNTGFYRNETNSVGFDAQTGAFTADLTLTGATSGATGTIESITDNGTFGKLVLSSISGTFEDGETVTDTSTGSATVDVYSVLTNTRLDPVVLGSTSKGYFITGSNVVFTGHSTTDIYTLRYLPKATEITAIGDDLIIPDEYIDYVLKAIDCRYSLWDEDPRMESLSDFRFARVLSDIAENINRDVPDYSLEDYSDSYV